MSSKGIYSFSAPCHKGGFMKYKGLKKIILIMLLGVCMQIQGKELPKYNQMLHLKPYEVILEDGTLLLSNSPECVMTSGLLYQDTLTGKGRLVYHHTNGTKRQDLVLMIMIENKMPQGQMLHLKQIGQTKSCYNYLLAGEKVLEQYYKQQPSLISWLAPGEKRILYQSVPNTWKPDTVLSGMIDLEVEGTVMVHFYAVPKSTSIEALQQCKPLAKDEAPRGTFHYLTKHHYVAIPPQSAYYLIEEAPSAWLIGKDALTNEIAINHGNYGVVYHITMLATQDTQVFVSPRGGIFQGLIRWQGKKNIRIYTPHAFKTKRQCVKLGVLKKGETQEMEYILPNGSAAPILIGFEKL